MRTLTVLAAAAAALAVAGAAAAGGFATLGVSPLPSGDSTTWEPTITVRAHGVTPVDGVQPVITIWRNDKPSEQVEFRATPAGAEGTYAARVEFPGPGVWSFTISDGYAGQTHTFKPVEIAVPAAPAGRAPAAPAEASGAFPWALAAAALLGALGLLVLAHRRRSAAAVAAR